jgi:hypothetical protein
VVLPEVDTGLTAFTATAGTSQPMILTFYASADTPLGTCTFQVMAKDAPAPFAGVARAAGVAASLELSVVSLDMVTLPQTWLLAHLDVVRLVLAAHVLQNMVYI